MYIAIRTGDIHNYNTISKSSKLKYEKIYTDNAIGGTGVPPSMRMGYRQKEKREAR